MTVLSKSAGVAAGAVVAFALATMVWADTTDVKGPAPLVVKKSGAHCADDPNCFNRYNPNIKPVAHADPGQVIVIDTRDAFDGDFTFDTSPDDVAAADLNLVQPMTGPIYINGAKRGDVLAITLLDIAPDDYGYTVIVPGFGFLHDVFPDPFIVNWHLTRLQATSEQMPGIAVPMAAFVDSVGVLLGEPETDAALEREQTLATAGGFVLTPQPTGARPADLCGPDGAYKERCLRTLLSGENGGNMDVRQMQIGTTLLLPCFIDGCGLFAGDVRYAQGDGGASGTAIKMGAVVTVRAEIRKGLGAFVKRPRYEGGTQLKALEPGSVYATTGVPVKKWGEVPVQYEYLSDKIINLGNLNEDLTLASRNALLDMIDYVVREHGLTREQAYILSGVAVDIRISQGIDMPNYIVSAVVPLDVFK